MPAGCNCSFFVWQDQVLRFLANIVTKFQNVDIFILFCKMLRLLSASACCMGSIKTFLRSAAKWTTDCDTFFVGGGLFLFRWNLWLPTVAYVKSVRSDHLWILPSDLRFWYQQKPYFSYHHISGLNDVVFRRYEWKSTELLQHFVYIVHPVHCTWKDFFWLWPS